MSSIDHIDQQNKLANQIRSNQVKEALEISLNAERSARAINYKAGLASSLETIAYCYSLTGDPSAALVNANKSFAIYNELNNTIGMYEVSNVLGRIYWELGDYPSALQCTVDLVDYAHQLEDSKREAIARNNLAVLYSGQNLPHKSLKELQKAIQLYRENDDKFEEHKSCNNLATIYSDLGSLEEASKYASLALDYFDQPLLNLDESIREDEKAKVLNTLGRIYGKKGEDQQALKFFKQALESSVKIKHIRNQHISLADIGRIHLKLKEAEKALPFFEKAIDLAKSIKSKKELFEYYLALSETYEMIGDSKSALIYYKHFFEENKSVFGDEQDQRLKQLEIKYRTESIQRESELLTEKNVALQGLADELDDEVNRKTAELRTTLENEKSLKRTLALALNKEKELNRLKSNIINTMSHEFRTPLNAIIGYSEMLTEDIEENSDDSTIYLDDISRIKKAGRHLLQLINDVLALSKVEENNPDINLSLFSIESMLTYVIEMISSEIDKQNNQFSLINKLTISEIRSDEVKLKQILINLLNNAAKFTENGEIQLTIFESDKDEIIFEVKDTGIGISEENLEQIFDSFYQVENSLSRNYQGTGLGLAISSRFASILNGRISVQSKLGQGSTFTFTLPKL